MDMEIQASAALMIQANGLDAVRDTLAATQAAPPTPEQHADVILQLSTAAQQLMTTQARASHTPEGGVPAAQDPGRPLIIKGRGAMLSPTMSAHDLHNQLLELRAERALAEETGVAGIRSYMADLERDIARSHAAYVGAAVTELATFRGELDGRNFG